MVMKKKPMKKKGMARGGAMKKKGMARGGAKMPMAKDPKTGKMVPAFAMDGKGKMAKGGMMKKKKGYAKGGMMKKKGMAKGGMKKKGYNKGGAVKDPFKGLTQTQIIKIIQANIAAGKGPNDKLDLSLGRTKRSKK